MPRLGLRGILHFTTFEDVAILSGAGVGGGSLVYANTLYRAPTRFFEDPQWAGLADWKTDFAEHYRTAERMLGMAPVTFDDPGVNPSLTITALAERTTSKIEPKPGVPRIEPVRMTWEVPRPQTSIVPVASE